MHFDSKMALVVIRVCGQLLWGPASTILDRAKEARELTREQKKEVLAYSMFLKRKHGRNIKGRG